MASRFVRGARGRGTARATGGAVAVLLVATFLGGCARARDGDGGAGGDGNPVRGGTLVRAINYGDPRNLDPILATDVANEMVVRNLFSRLTAYDPEQKKLVGDVAEEFSSSDDSRTWTFLLKQGAKFSNGRRITAADVKYSLERLTNPANGSPAGGTLVDVVGAEDFRAGRAPEIVGIRAEGERQLVVVFRIPFPLFAETVSKAATSIVPREEVERLGAEFGRRPVGSGPFVLESWTPDDRLVLKANPEYHGGRPWLDEVVFRIAKEEATRDADFRSGALDMMTLGEDTYTQYSADAQWRDQIIEVAELFTRAVFFNTTVEPFDDVRVRRAVNHAIDKHVVVERALGNKAFPATGPLQRSSPAFDPELEGYRFDPAEARRLLAEAGLPNGFEMEVVASPTGVRAVEALVGYLKDVGITVRIVQSDTTTSVARDGNFQTIYYSTGGDLDPVSFLMARFHSRNHGAPGNVTRYTNTEVDALLDRAMASKDQAERVRLAQEAQRLIVADAPWFFFNYNKAALVHKREVHGLQAVPTDVDFQDLTKVWKSPG